MSYTPNFIKSGVGLLFVLFTSTLSAQINKNSIWVAPFTHDTLGKKYDQYMVDCRGAALRALLASGRFSVVDRDAIKELESERQLQKSESFIDGKVVEQGRAVGAEYILTGKMNGKTGLLSLEITSVETAVKVEGGECNLKEGFISGGTGLPSGYTTSKVRKTMSEILGRWLAKDRYTIVRALEEDEKSVDKVLMAAGSTRGIRKDMVLEVFYTTSEVVDSLEIERDIQVAEMKVEKVENGNFSILKEKKGKKELRLAFNEKRKLYARIKTK